MFEIEATDSAARTAFFRENPALRVRQRPADFSRAARIAPQAWGEHCVECAIPHCYETCDLYDARPDGKCRRFTFGIHPNRDVRSWLPYAVEIDFRVISHLWTKGSAATLPLWQYRALDAGNRLLARAVNALSTLLGPLSGRRRPNRGFYHARKEFLRWLQRRGSETADGFLLQVINPHEDPLDLRFELSPDPRPRGRAIFQTRFRLPPGFSEHWVPVRRIRRHVDIERPFEMSLLLGNTEPTLLYLLAATFVGGVSGPLTDRMGTPEAEAVRSPSEQLRLPVIRKPRPARTTPAAATGPSARADGTAPVDETVRADGTTQAKKTARADGTSGPAQADGATQADGARKSDESAEATDDAEPDRPPAKCVVWDLDRTLWDGILVESGETPPALRPGVRDLVLALDERGILQSVVSKNHHDEAWARLEALGLAEYFLHPQIGWGPKSDGVGRVIRELNIGADSVVFLDDQAFERAEVARAHPDVEVLPESAVEGLLERPRFPRRPGGEGRQRRLRYRDEARRAAVLEEHGSDYESFLRSARIVLDVRPPRAAELDRVHELIQRTNQMNFSGNRYTREEVEARLAKPDLDAFVVRARDRFGDYGLVGFALVRVEVEGGKHGRDQARRDAIVREVMGRDALGREEVGRGAEGRARLIDLALSCRIQSKHVEHQFLLTLLDRYRERGLHRFEAEFRRSDRNGPAARVFDDLGFTREEDTPDGREVYGFDLARESRRLDYIDVVTGLAREAAS